MFRSKRTFSVVLSLALGVLVMACLHSFGLLPNEEAESDLAVNTAAGRPKPRPTAGSTDGRATDTLPEGEVGSTAVEPVSTSGASDDVRVPMDLVPSDACLYVEVTSFRTIERVARDMIGRFDASAAVMFDGDMMLNQMLSPFGGELADVDKGRPMAFAFSVPRGGQPRPTLMLPVHAPEEFSRGLRLPPGFAEPRRSARYVGLSMGTDYPVARGGAPIATGLEPATVTGRFRLDPVRDQVLMGVDQARSAGSDMMSSLDVPVPAAYEWGQDFAYDLIAGLDHVDLALDLDDERMAMHMAFGFSPGSSLVRPLADDPSDLSALAAFATPEDDLVAVAGWDQAFLDEVLLPFFDELSSFATSEEDEDAFDDLEAVTSFLPSMGEQVGVFADFEVGQAHLALVGRPPEPDSLLAMTSMAAAGIDREALPVSIGSFRGVDVEGGRAARLEIDLSKAPDPSDATSMRVREMLALLFGSEQVEIQVTSKDGWLLVTLGSDAEWRDALVANVTGEGPQREVSDDFLRLVDRTAGASPCFAYSIDLLAAQRNLMALMAEQMGLDASAEMGRIDAAVGTDPLPLGAYGAVQGDRWVFGGEVELSRLMTLLELIGD